MNHWQAWLYFAAVLTPLAAFVVQFLLMRVLGRRNAYIATAAIAASFVLSATGFIAYIVANPAMVVGREEAAHGHSHGEFQRPHHSSFHQRASVCPVHNATANDRLAP